MCHRPQPRGIVQMYRRALNGAPRPIERRQRQSLADLLGRMSHSSVGNVHQEPQ
jgi:hypothetical protein